MAKQLVLERNNHKYLFFAVAVLILLIYGRDIFQINVSSVVFTAISIAIALPMTYNVYMCYLFFLYPLGNGLPGSYMMPLLALLWFIKKRNLPSKPALLFFVIISFSEVLHFMSYQFDCDYLMAVRYLSCFFLFVASISDMSNDSSQHVKRAEFFVLGSVIAVLCIIIRTYLYLLGTLDAFDIIRVGELDNIDESLGGKIMLSMNPNAMAFVAVTSISICLCLYQKKVVGNKLLLISAIIVLLVSVFLSLSRSGVLVLGFLLVLFSFSGRGSKGMTAILVVGIVLIGVIYFMNEYGVLEQLFGRFSDETASSGGNRTDVLKSYNKFLADNNKYLWFGTGAVYSKVVAGIETSMHNSIQQILVSYGIFGLTLFVWAAIKLAKQFKHSKFIAWIPVIVVLLNMQTIQFLIPFAMLYPIVAAFEVVKGINTSN